MESFPLSANLITIFRLSATCCVRVVIFLITWPWDALISPAASINQQNYVNILTCCKSDPPFFSKVCLWRTVCEMKQSEKYLEVTVWVILHVHTCCWERCFIQTHSKVCCSVREPGIKVHTLKAIIMP